jgi:hypothetical protein
MRGRIGNALDTGKGPTVMMAWMSLLLLAAPAQSDKKEAKWLTKYQEALQLAQKEGKPLVVDGSRVG